nr:MAG TPA: hypothetical protein [Caudoviricetes sp.]DAZ08391.1 MAG TPA: hypothetical protein [Caudoviricetes sp.]
MCGNFILEYFLCFVKSFAEHFLKEERVIN